MLHRWFTIGCASVAPRTRGIIRSVTAGTATTLIHSCAAAASANRYRIALTTRFQPLIVRTTAVGFATATNPTNPNPQPTPKSAAAAAKPLSAPPPPHVHADGSTCTDPTHNHSATATGSAASGSGGESSVAGKSLACWRCNKAVRSGSFFCTATNCGMLQQPIKQTYFQVFQLSVTHHLTTPHSPSVYISPRSNNV